MNRPLFKPDYDRLMRGFLTHRRSTHYDKMINVYLRRGWDDLTRFVDCPVCAVYERQLARAGKPS